MLKLKPTWQTLIYDRRRKNNGTICLHFCLCSNFHLRCNSVVVCLADGIGKWFPLKFVFALKPLFHNLYCIPLYVFDFFHFTDPPFFSYFTPPFVFFSFSLTFAFSFLLCNSINAPIFRFFCITCSFSRFLSSLFHLSLSQYRHRAHPFIKLCLLSPSLSHTRTPSFSPLAAIPLVLCQILIPSFLW